MCKRALNANIVHTWVRVMNRRGVGIKVFPPIYVCGFKGELLLGVRARLGDLDKYCFQRIMILKRNPHGEGFRMSADAAG